MKKSKFNFIRAGALTMVLAMGTTCFMSGTLAKYVTSGTGGDTARVAKFGVTVDAGGQMFKTDYAKDDSSFSLAAHTVVSSNSDKLVAPGTKDSLTRMTLSGTPEVAVRVNYEVTKFELTNWTTNGTDQYCPIIIKVNNEEFNCLTSTDINTFKTNVENAIEAYSKDYVANTDLSTVANNSLAISWEWPFSTSAENDIKDTALGDRAAANIADAGKIELEIKTTVTQID